MRGNYSILNSVIFYFLTFFLLCQSLLSLIYHLALQFKNTKVGLLIFSYDFCLLLVSHLPGAPLLPYTYLAFMTAELKCSGVEFNLEKYAIG